MFAYRLPQADQPMEAAEHPSAARILPAGPWQFSAHPQGGTLATWKDASGRVPAMTSFGEGRETADGLVYYPAKAPLTIADLLRPAIPSAINVTLRSGQSLPIARAAASARKLVFGVGGTLSGGDYLTEYARLAEQLREKVKREGDVNGDDPLLGRVVLLALQQSLRATEEALTDLGVVSNVDFLPIVVASWGYDPDPKTDGADGAASRSPAPA